MLTADLVRATRRAGELKLSSMSGKTRERALELSESLLEAAREHVGRTREELKESLTHVYAESREKKLFDGLAKLVDDACDFASESDLDPLALRTTLFELATEARRELAPGVGFDREALLNEVATRLGASPERIEGALFADLKGAHVLQRVEALSPQSLLERYDLSQRQAVLLRAVRVTAEVYCERPEDYRRLFRALKFRRLLFRILPGALRGYRLELDGPYSLFDSVTKYGLNLALALPALELCDSLELEAELRWGKAREPLKFRHANSRKPEARTAKAGNAASASSASASSAAPPLDELDQMVSAFEALDSGWAVAPASALLEHPGLGLLIPDLCFTPPGGGQPVYFELLGFWSRDAVWKRIELARAGLDAPVLFAASSRLRVSEELLDDVEQAALYLFKGALSAKAVLKRLELLRAAPGGSGAGPGGVRRPRG